MISGNECADAFARISKLHPKLIDLSTDRIDELLTSLGSPHEQLTNVFHIAGTNGKGSTSAYLTAIAQAWGKTASVMTSPHLVSVTERFRVANKLLKLSQIDDLLEEIITKNNGKPLTIFEALTAVGFLSFSRKPADINIIEVGLGGRFDATNVITKPLASLITPISFDHQNFLGDTIEEIAAEKAGIIKSSVPVFSSSKNPIVVEILKDTARQKQSAFFQLGEEFNGAVQDSKMIFQDKDGEIELDLPSLQGQHQVENAALAIMAFKHTLSPPEKVFSGIKKASWPGRIQQLHGELTKLLPKESELWIDGAHNPDGALTLQKWLKEESEQKVHILFSCSGTRNPMSILEPILPFAKSMRIISEPNQQNAQPSDQIKSTLDANGVVTESAPTTLENALIEITESLEPNSPVPKVVIFGSLYLAGIALEKDHYKFQ